MSLREEHFFLHAEQRNSRLERNKKRDLALFYTLGTAKRSHITYIVYVQYVPVVPYMGTALNRFMPIFIT
jgi:hypothetical protein